MTKIRMKKIIINSNGRDFTLPRGNSVQYQTELFCKMIYYGYASITIDDIPATPDDVKQTIRKEV